LRLENYRAFRETEVGFANVTFLVGKNSSGKSTVLEALRLLSDAVRTPLTDLTSNRDRLGLLGSIFRDRLDNVGIELELSRGSDTYAYSASFFAPPLVMKEQLRRNGELIVDRDRDGEATVVGEDVKLFLGIVTSDLLIPQLSGIAVASPFVQALRSLHVFDLQPSELRDPRFGLDPSKSLGRSGSDLVSAVLALSQSRPDRYELLKDFLSAVVPGFRDMAVNEELTSFSVLEVGFEGLPTRLNQTELSDGFLFLLGNLTALLGAKDGDVVLLEEPERHLHPGALGAMADAIEIASRTCQIVITTQSPELLSAEWVRAEHLRLVKWHEAGSQIEEVSAGVAELLQRELSSAGELLRAGTLE
jgi:predicted ATPase